MRFEPDEMVAGIEAALEDERGFIPEMPDEVYRLASIVCSVMNDDGVYTKQDLSQQIKDMSDHSAVVILKAERAERHRRLEAKMNKIERLAKL